MRNNSAACIQVLHEQTTVHRINSSFYTVYACCMNQAACTQKKIDFSDTLLEEWQAIFRQQWRLWVANAYHQENFGMPLCHMRTEPFWYFCVKPGMEDAFEQKNRMKALSSLRQSVSGVEIDKPLARLLWQAETRAVLQGVLLAQLFEIL